MTTAILLILGLWAVVTAIGAVVVLSGVRHAPEGIETPAGFQVTRLPDAPCPAPLSTCPSRNSTPQFS